MPVKFFQKITLPSLLWLLTFAANGQNFPSSMFLSDADHVLYTGSQPSTGLYDESQIKVFKLWFSQADYWQQLKNNYQSHTDLPALLVVDGDTFPNVGVRFKGQTSYSQTQNSEKKSFNITLDYSDPNQDLNGYTTINLNNCFEDASFMREVSYLHQIRKHVPAAKACYVQLFINGTNWGMYPNVQQLNREYAKDWFFSNNGTMWRADRPSGSGGAGGPGWGDGTAALNFLGTDTATYKQYYTLKSTDKTNPWDDLVQVCEVLNDTPLSELESSVSQYLDLDRTLWFLASEIAFSDDDSYVFKGKMDYYLYWDPETLRMTPLEFDGNSVMKSNATNWGVFYNETKVNYPLLNRLLAVPAIRQRYLAHMRTLVQDEMDATTFGALVDQYDALINAGVMADTKKLYSNTQYTSEKQAIKTFVQNHRTTLLNNTEMSAVGPTIANVAMYNLSGAAWANPVENEAVSVQATVSASNGVAAVNAYYSAATYGNFTKIQMFDDGQHQDGASGDGVYGIGLPGQPMGTFVRFYVEAKSANAAGTVAYAPVGAEHNVYYYQVTAPWAPVRPVAINEVMASNQTTAEDENGQHEDWIELFNLTNAPVDLSGFLLSDNPANVGKWAFPNGATIPANGYLIVWADEDGAQGPLHASFKLSSSGEALTLADSQGRLVDTVSFHQQVTDMGFARVPNGVGHFVIQNPTYGASNNLVATHEAGAENWATIAPTLSSGSLQVDVTTTSAQLEIVDMQGNVILKKQLSGDNKLDISMLQKGAYVVRIQSEGRNKVVTIVRL